MRTKRPRTRGPSKTTHPEFFSSGGVRPKTTNPEPEREKKKKKEKKVIICSYYIHSVYICVSISISIYTSQNNPNPPFLSPNPVSGKTWGKNEKKKKKEFPGVGDLDLWETLRVLEKIREKKKKDNAGFQLGGDPMFR